MMLPIIIRACEEALRLVPTALRHASLALGATHFQTVRKAILPAALPSILTAILLGIARVSGETAPLLLTSSSNLYWPRSPGDATPSLPVYIFNYALSPYEEWHRQAWSAALVLVLAITIVNFTVRAVSGRAAVTNAE
jgi:phosphate transport system permease protein